jgi:hypothetical protein
MAPGSILSTQIPSDRSQYELYEVWFNKIDHIHTYGAAKVDFFCHFSVFSKMEGTVFYVGISTFVHKVPKPLYQLGTNHTTMTWLSQKPPQSGSHFHLLYI